MINLLPSENRKQLAASKQNGDILRSIFVVLGTMAVLVGMFAVIYIALTNSENLANQSYESNQTRIAEYKEVEANANKLLKDLSKAQQVLAQRVNYSNVLIKIAQALPSKDVTISSIQLDSKLFNDQAKSLTINAKSQDQVIETKNAFEKSGLFKSVKIDEIGTETLKDETEITRSTFSVKFNRQGFEL